MKKKMTKIILTALAVLLGAGILLGGQTVLAAKILNNTIGLGNAVKIAMEAAGLPEDQTVVDDARLTLQSGKLVYRVSLLHSDREFSYQLLADDGSILASDVNDSSAQTVRTITVSPRLPKTDTASDAARLDAESAKQIALKHAGLEADAVEFTKVKSDTDGGNEHYDIEFYHFTTEYDYEVDAYSGEILDVDVDFNERPAVSGEAEVSQPAVSDVASDQPTSAPSEPTAAPKQSNSDDKNFIGVDKAKQIALAHAGFSESEVRFTKSKLDRDDGRYEYEIEFRVNGIEYEYEIDAKSGKILKHESERDDD